MRVMLRYGMKLAGEKRKQKQASFSIPINWDTSTNVAASWFPGFTPLSAKMDKLKALFKRQEKPAFTIHSSKRDTLVTLATLFVFVLFGLPLWHQTTSIYRATLPEDSIKSLTNEFKIVQPVNLLLEFAFVRDKGSAASVAQTIKAQIKRNSKHYLIKPKDSRPIFKYATKTLVSKDQIVALDEASSKGIDIKISFIQSEKITAPQIFVSQDGQISVFSSDLLKDDIGSKVAQFYDQMIISEIKLLKRSVYFTQRQKSTWERLAALKFSPEFLINFSLISEGSSDHRFDWQVEKAIEKYLKPFIDSINDLTTFKVTSQIQQFATLDAKPSLVNGTYALGVDSLTNFINAAEWNFASTIPETPSIQMVMFIPNAQRHPLHLLDSKGEKSKYNSFLLPQWGGVVVNNQKPKVSALESSPNEDARKFEYEVEDLKHIFGVYLTHLRQLLGVKCFDSKDIKVDGIEVVYEKPNSGEEVLSFWEHRYLQTKFTILNTADSISTLGSLVDLTNNISSMAIGDGIQEKVTKAVDFLNQIRTKKARTPDDNFFWSVMANKLSSKAFFDPTMVAMLYFPAEHKYAIYMPLFIPVTLPVLATVLRLIKKRKDKAKTKAKTKMEEEDGNAEHGKEKTE